MASITSLTDSPDSAQCASSSSPRAERVLLHGVVGLDPVRPGRRLVHDEPAADRVVGPLAHQPRRRRRTRRSASRWGGTAAPCGGAARGRPRPSRRRGCRAGAIRPACRTASARACAVAVSTVSGSSPSRPRITARSLPWPCPVAPSEPNSSARTRVTSSISPSSARPAANVRAARIGPTVCERRRADADREQVEHADGHPAIMRRPTRSGRISRDQPAVRVTPGFVTATIRRSPVHSCSMSVRARTLTPRMRRVTIRSAGDGRARDPPGPGRRTAPERRHGPPRQTPVHDPPRASRVRRVRPGRAVARRRARVDLGRDREAWRHRLSSRARAASWNCGRRPGTCSIGDESALPAIAAISEQCRTGGGRSSRWPTDADELPLRGGRRRPLGASRRVGRRHARICSLPAVQALDLGSPERGSGLPDGRDPVDGRPAGGAGGGRLRP